MMERRPFSSWLKFIPLLLATQAVCFMPEFSAPVANVTVARGRDAKFTCLVRHLGGYRVGWVKADTKAIQAIHTRVITNDARVHVSFDDHFTWHLIIKEVTEDDKGPYMCQINTNPMISQLGHLEILRPPEIDDEMSSSDVVADEGQMATLKCVANGHPKPTVTWIREDNANITISDGVISKQVRSWEGEELTLRRVFREDMGAYLCIAQNTVPPQVSKCVSLHVHFHPIIHVPNQLIGSPYGSNVTLECKVEASPKPVTFWSNSLDIAPPTTQPPRLPPTYIETNRVDGDNIILFSPGLTHFHGALTPLDALGNEVFKIGPAEGSGMDPWQARPRHEKGSFVPTSDVASLPGLRPWFPENKNMENALGASSSTSNHISSGLGITNILYLSTWCVALVTHVLVVELLTHF